jgi:hypothetical protein
MSLKEIAEKDVDWINLFRDRVQCRAVLHIVMNRSIKDGAFLNQLSDCYKFSKRTLLREIGIITFKWISQFIFFCTLKV